MTTTTTTTTTNPTTPAFLLPEVTAEQSTNVTLSLYGFRKEVTIEHLRLLIDAMRQTADQWEALAGRIEAARTPGATPATIPGEDG